MRIASILASIQPRVTLPLGQTNRQHYGVLIIRGAFAVLVAVVLGVLWFAIAQPVQVVPRMQPAPAFTLIDQHGDWVRLDDLRGSFVVLSFSAPSCDAPCANAIEQVQRLQSQLEAQGIWGNQVRFLTISLTPEQDTPETLAQLAHTIGATTPAWHVLTGSASELKAIVGGELGVYYQQRSTGFAHDARVFLIDGNGLLRSNYTYQRIEAQRMFRDIQLLQDEFASSGLERSIYEAAHIFLCYPD